MIPLVNALACLIALGCASFLWKKGSSPYRNGALLVGALLLFCVFTIAMGMICDRLYEKSGSIWTPSICHGAVNAAATLPLALCLSDTGSARLLGPVPNGLIAGIPFLAAAVIIMLRSKKADSV